MGRGKRRASPAVGGTRAVGLAGARCDPEIPAARKPASPGIWPARPPDPSLTRQRTGAPACGRRRAERAGRLDRERWPSRRPAMRLRSRLLHPSFLISFPSHSSIFQPYFGAHRKHRFRATLQHLFIP